MDIERISQITGIDTTAGPEEAVWERLERRPDKRDAKTGLVIKAGRPVPTLSNAVRILTEDSRWSGRIKYNEFSNAVEIDGIAVADHIESGVNLWVDRTYMMSTPTNRISEAIVYIARQNVYHPIREHIRGIEWDGTERVDSLLSEYAGVVDTPLTREISRRFLISCVARIFQPGCKVDTCLVLVGKQGARKSSFLRKLAMRQEYYSDTQLDLGSKDSYQSLAGGVWIYELAELASFSKRDQETIKSFISASVDRYRPSYGRWQVAIPRQTVFCGTTNNSEFLSDSTGNRRFWTVKVGAIKLLELGRDVEQIWAEALAYYRQGERWWLEENGASELEAAQETYRQVDAWEQETLTFLRRTHGEFTARDALVSLGFEDYQITKSASMRMAAVLQKLGCGRQPRRREGGIRISPWKKEWTSEE